MVITSKKCLSCFATELELVGKIKGIDSYFYQVFRCRRCELVFVDPIRALKDLYDYNEQENLTYFTLAQAVSYSLKGGSIKKAVKVLVKTKPYFKKILQIAPLINSKSYKIADIGCGYGYFLGILRKSGHETWGVDLSTQALEKARSLFGLDNLYTDIQVLPERYFDYVFALNLIEHVEKPFEIFREINRIIAPGGKIIICTPNPASFNWETKVGDLKWPSSLPPIHLSLWGKKALEHLFKRCGYKNIEFFYSHLGVIDFETVCGLSKTGIVSKLNKLFGLIRNSGGKRAVLRKDGEVSTSSREVSQTEINRLARGAKYILLFLPWLLMKSFNANHAQDLIAVAMKTGKEENNMSRK